MFISLAPFILYLLALVGTSTAFLTSRLSAFKVGSKGLLAAFTIGFKVPLGF
jgi:NADH:ubiquinone oxidoreductase subunit 5 (subunit L)/multisubunit Na+/H+ antiporter MnhA subunit